MTTKQAVRILIRNAAANICGTAQGIRPAITDTERAEVREAVRRVFKSAHGREVDDNCTCPGKESQ